MPAEPSLLSDLFAAADEALFLLAPDGSVLYGTPAGERLIGLPESCGKSVSALFERAAALDHVVQLMAAGELGAATRQLSLQHQTGRRLSLHCNIARWNGDPAVLVFVREDHPAEPESISAAQRAAMTKSELMFRALFDSSLFVITVSDARTGKFFEVNAAFERSTGIARMQAIGKTAAELGLVTPGVEDHYLDQLITDGATKIEIIPHLGRDGRRRQSMFCSTVVELDGEPLVFSLAFEVTDFLRARDELRESDSKFRALFDNIVDAMFFVDSTGRFIEVNAAACTQLGYTRDQLLATSALSVLGGNEFDFAEVTTRLREAGQLTFESTQQRKDGSSFPIGLTLAAIEYRGSYAIAGIGRDLSERKQREEELERINDELMRFAYTVSHDLKSPLVTIRSFLGYLREDLAGKDYERVESDFGHIGRAAERMGTLLDDLLELSRVGRKVNPPERVELAQLVRAAAEQVAGRLATSKAALHVRVDGVWLWGDRSRLLEVFQNLIDNAVKFAAPGIAPEITVDATHVQGELVIAVRDRGIGIDPRHQHKLFGLFEKLHQHAEGTGIGLALVKRIIEVHGGRVWVESGGEARGTAICFVLPGTTEEEQS